MAILTKHFTTGECKFSEDDFLVKAPDGAVICSLSPRLPNTRGVMTQKANGYLLAQANSMYEALSLYVKDEEKVIRKYKFNGIPHNPSEQYKWAVEILKKAVPHGK